MDKKELAVEYKRGMNCCQAVIRAYADELGIDEQTALALGSAFGMGMGNTQGTCGALVGAGIVLGLMQYSGRPLGAKARALIDGFKSRCHATLCCDLKGVYTGTVLCSCDDCVRNAVETLEEVMG